MPTIELLCISSCPHSREALDRVRAIIAELGTKAEVQQVLVETDLDALRLHFLGSPTVRVDGRDVDPEAGRLDDYGLQCRMYRDEGKLTGLPPVAWIRDALRTAAAG